MEARCYYCLRPKGKCDHTSVCPQCKRLKMDCKYKGVNHVKDHALQTVLEVSKNPEKLSWFQKLTGRSS